MPHFFATCSQGLSETLKSEIEQFDSKFKSISAKQKGVEFESSWEGAFEVNYKSRVASRVLKPVLNFTAPTEDQIVPHLKKHDFTKYIKKEGTFSLRVKTTMTSVYKDQPGLMNQIRIGLLNEFEAKGRSDIKVSPKNADLEIFVTVYKANFSISLNLSGEPLSHRGYRLSHERAPLRENLAAGLIKMTDWDRSTPLVDFMCGSGTFLMEAALIDEPLDISTRKYSFEKWPFLDQEVIKKLRTELLKSRRFSKKRIYGFDQDPRALASVKETLSAQSRLQSQIQVKQQSLKDLKVTGLTSEEKGVVILNPPYGKRLGDPQEAQKAYKLIGETLKAQFGGWKAYILSPDPELSKELGMKASFKQNVDNGGVSCAFLGYEIRD